jgi:hypothetical protein
MNGLEGWTGAGIGEGITTAPLHARAAPDAGATSITVWPQNTIILLWHKRAATVQMELAV